MTKRAKRYRNPNLPQEAFNNPIATSSPTVSATGGAAGRVTPSAAGAATATTARRLNWQEEYSEVLGDLRRTAIIAVALIAVMIVLSFVIR